VTCFTGATGIITIICWRPANIFGYRRVLPMEKADLGGNCALSDFAWQLVGGQWPDLLLQDHGLYMLSTQ
jgi:hypothetical protein